MPATHVRRIGDTFRTGAEITPTPGPGLRSLEYTLSAMTAGGSYDLSWQVVDENGDNVAEAVGVRFDLFDDYQPNSGFAATALVKGVTAGSMLNTSNGGTAYPTHFGETSAAGLIAFRVGPSLAAIAGQAQRYTLIGVVTPAAAPDYAVAPVVSAFTCTPPAP